VRPTIEIETAGCEREERPKAATRARVRAQRAPALPRCKRRSAPSAHDQSLARAGDLRDLGLTRQSEVA
jgi:hypothetical protein